MVRDSLACIDLNGHQEVVNCRLLMVLFAGLVKASDSDSTVTKLADFATLQTAMKGINPQGVSMSSYNPTNKPADCPVVNSTWQSSGTSLPPTPNNSACECAANASTCVPKSGLATSGYGSIFSYICSSDASLCSSINGNTSTGKYGTYSMCSDEQKLAIVLGAYHAKNSAASDSCSFGGNATVQKGSGSTNCASLAPTSGSSSGSSGSGSGSSNSSSKKNGSAIVGPSGYGFMASVASLTALVITAMVAM